VAPRLTGNAYPQPPSASIFTLRPTTPKPDKSDGGYGKRGSDPVTFAERSRAVATLPLRV